MHAHILAFIYAQFTMSRINTADCAHASHSEQKCICIKSYKMLLRNPQKRAANFQMLIKNRVKVSSSSPCPSFTAQIFTWARAESPGLAGENRHPSEMGSSCRVNWQEYSPVQNVGEREEGAEQREEWRAESKPQTRQNMASQGNVPLHIFWHQCQPMSN